MSAEIAQKDTPAPVTVAKGGRGSSGVYELIVKREIVASEQRGVDWTSMPLNEAVLINPPTKLLRGESYPFVDMAAISAGRRNVEANEDRIFAGGGSRFKDGDTLMARITPCLENGKIARFKAVSDACVGHGSTEFIVLRGKPGVSDSAFAYYLATEPSFHAFAVSQMTGTSGRQRVPTNALGSYMVQLPPLAEQKRIASILGALDDKIELNRRMNAKLEDMARALFKSWFVDFDPLRAKLDGRPPAGMDAAIAALFPDAFEESALGLIPKGWEALPVGDVVECVGGSTPSTAVPSYWEGGTHHWTTPKDFSTLQSPILLDTSRKITYSGLKQISSGLLPAGTLLMSSRAPVGYLAISVMPVAINQGFIAMKCNAKASNYFMLNWCQTNMLEIEVRATGTTFAEISKQNFRPILLLLPSMEVVASFTAIVEPLYEQITINLNHSQTLSNLRDSLLPMLLNR